MAEVCDKCKEAGEDRRTLWMACLYEMNELGLPFKEQTLASGVDHSHSMKMYTLRVCKECRAEWMGAIKTWFNSQPARGPTGTGVWIRVNGATVEATQEEVDELIKIRGVAYGISP